MKKMIFFYLLIFFFVTSISYGAPGDTTVVQTFTFGSPQDSTFKFPEHSKKYSRILMYYTLKCNAKQKPACGEWDYLTYTYLYRPTNRFDSSISHIYTTFDSSHHVLRVDTMWKVKTHLDRYELGRFITPYGINLSLGNGFTWIYDVSDYEPFLHDSVHLSAGNRQELLDLKFIFIEGTPSPEPYKIVNVWSGRFNYGGAAAIDSLMGTKRITIDPSAGAVRLKVRVTGHGFGGNDNCSEFCPRNHTISIDGVNRWTQRVWRDNCGQNPVYPQGGTWVYNRSNWCPGAEVRTYNADITPYAAPGKTISMRYMVDPYVWNGQGSTPYYAVEAQLIYYKKPLFNLDAAIEDIIAPSTADMYRRINPICTTPEVSVSNHGTTPITSLTFEYDIQGGVMGTYTWKGDTIPFGGTADITLPPPVYSGSGFPNFKVSIQQVNGQDDENKENNTAYSRVPLTDVMPADFVINLRTNSAPEQNSYTLTDAEGHILYQRSDMEANTLYRDTVHLTWGCYTFDLKDEGDNGLSFFAAPKEGSGYLRFYQTNRKLLKDFNPDFGSGITYHFNAVYALPVHYETAPAQLQIYPNPTSGKAEIDFTTLPSPKGVISIYNMYGQLINTLPSNAGEGRQKINLQSQPAGIYFVYFQTKDALYVAKLLKD